MHAALHLVAQSPQLLHLSESMRTLNNENRLNKPKIVPTGQIVLHQVRPCFHAIIKIIVSMTPERCPPCLVQLKIIVSMTTAMKRDEILKIEVSTW